jgi:hypothetical protein
MALTSHNSDDHTPWPELGDALLSAVEQVRRSMPPPTSVDRAMTRARLIGQSGPGLWSGRRVQLFATTAAAVSLLLILGWRHGAYPPGGYLARLKNKSGGDEQAALRLVQAKEKDDDAAEGHPHLVRAGNRFAPDLDPGDLQAVGLEPVGSQPDEWERAQALRDLSRGMSDLDRQGIESHIRRLPRAKRREQADLRVTVRWSVEATVVLTMIEPGGKKKEAPPLCGTGHGTMCFYQVRDADPGEYEVQVGLNKFEQAAAGEVSILVEIVRYYGSACEEAYRQTILLRKVGQRVRVARIGY